MDDEKTTPELKLPSFRFHPTEEELLDIYLKNRVFTAKKRRVDVIGFLNIYHHDPWELPGEREWYFFVPKNRKQGHGGRSNRITQHGFWKATGSERLIRSFKDPNRVISLKKTLVFYNGRAPRGCKTDWVMNEYRMPNDCTLPKADIVLCKIYRKATCLKVLEQRAMVMEEEMKTSKDGSPCSIPETISLVEDDKNMGFSPSSNCIELKVEENISTATLTLQNNNYIPQLQLPKQTMDWMKDPFFTQLCSPWMLDLWTPHANILDF